ncbi:MAG TPA: hypothetical protein VNI60_10135 [Pyrinomonadaceae bacterium]|nr:hypothetical protein [Pyrinomonadaceae bacterium]
MYQRKLAKLIIIWLVFSSFGCQRSNFQPPTVAPATLRDVPALKLNFRLETDVPVPPAAGETAQMEERNVAVQTDFDQNRTQELVDKTIVSPNKQRVLAVYHKAEDSQGDFRLDMYSADGKLLRRITPDGMAVHYPDTIVWSPDSANVAFMAMTRAGQTSALSSPTPVDNQANTASNSEIDANTDVNTNANMENASPAATQPPIIEQPKAVLTFRTEQIYISNADGGDLKPVTQNEGLIYFYFVWSPDGSALAALAATIQEWRFLQYQAESRSEAFAPAGRPRLVEKTGRERRLDDNLTIVHPAWSPDSAKVAVAFDKQVRIYDAIGDQPTQAAIPLRNQLLISSKVFDDDLQQKEQSGNANTDANAAVNSNAQSNANAQINTNTQPNNAVNQPIGTLPDENTLVSFNPIIDLKWTEDKMLYLQTGYIKQMKNEADSARSYLRWHRLIFSPQAVALGN